MASVKGVLVVGVTIVAAVGVYFGLNKAFPKHVEKGEMPDIVASADEVFGKSISENAQLPAPKAPPPTAPPTQIAQGEPPPVAGSETAAAAAQPAEPAPSSAAPAEPSKPAEPKLAESPKPAEPAKSSSSQQALLVPEPAATSAPSSGSAKMPDTTMPSGDKPAEAPKPAPAKSTKPAAPAPKPAEPAAKPAEMEPKPAPKPAEPAPKPAPKAAEPAPKPAAAPAKPAPAAPAAASSTRWWGDPKEQDPRRLNLSYAGPAAGQKGIALLFTGTFASAGVANWIKVTDANGKAAAGHWELGASPKMLQFVGTPPGRYTVTVSPDLKDAQGKTLGRKLSGPVTVQ